MSYKNDFKQAEEPTTAKQAAVYNEFNPIQTLAGDSNRFSLPGVKNTDLVKNTNKPIMENFKVFSRSRN